MCMAYKKPLWIVLSALIGLFFLFSAWTKTYPIQYFEFITGEQLGIPYSLASILARVVIGIEAAIGFLLLFQIYGKKKWVVKACIALLVIFSVHLVYLILAKGNDINCGCMGSVATMTPAASLIKNAVLLAIAILLLKNETYMKKRPFYMLSWIVPFACVGGTFIAFPAQSQIHLPVSQLYIAPNGQRPSIELGQGKHILCFMSLSCGHCMDAAKAIAEMKAENPLLPFYIVFTQGKDSGRAERYETFMKETHAQNIPHHFMDHKEFTKMVRETGSNGVPVILWMKDSTIIRKVFLPELDKKEIEQWVHDR